MKTIHESPRLFICPLCGKQLAREKGLNQHVRTIHEGNWAVFCSVCGKGFINRCRLKKHCTNVHDSLSEREAIAKREHRPDYHATSTVNGAQNKEATTPDSLRTQPTSSDDQPLDLSIRKPCCYSPSEDSEYSGFLFPSKESPQQSFAEVSSTSRGPSVGDEKAIEADTHGQVKDTKAGRHKCTYCEKSFASKEYLRLHEATIHEGTKSFICSACGKHFSVHQALRKHCVIQHEGGKPYRCRDCQMEFRTRAMLRSHRSTTHNKSVFTLFATDRFTT